MAACALVAVLLASPAEMHAETELVGHVSRGPACLDRCAVESADGVRPQDHVFLISTRSLGWQGCGADMARLTCQEFVPADASRCCRWRSVPLDAFYAADDPKTPTIVYVHGNRISAGEDRERGLAVYRSLLAWSRSEAPIRFLIFSWPTTEGPRPLQDFQMKAGLSDLTAHHLAWVVDRMAPDVPTALVGYSYGARVIGGALHLLGGGSHCGCGLDERVHPVRAPVRVVYLAAAVSNGWMLPGQCHAMAPSQVDRMLLSINPCDPAMRYFHFSTHRRCRNRRCRPVALGRHGIANWAMVGDLADRVEQMDVCCHVGREHRLHAYLAVDRLMSRAWDLVSFQDLVDRTED